MRLYLRLIALLLAVAVIVAWASLGAHRGWTKTSITEMKIDPITELEYPEHRNQFVPGLELLGAGIGCAAALAAASFLFPKKKNQP